MGWLGLDLDGTLLDARPRQVGLAVACARQVGHTLDADRFWAQKRRRQTTLAAYLACGLSEGQAADAARAWGEHIEDDVWLAQDPLLPRVDEALTLAESLAIPVKVLTARRRPDAVRAQLEHLGLLPRLAALHVVDPRRAELEKAELLVGADLFIGDTESDAEAARLAGVPFIAVSSGLRDAETLSALDLIVAEDVLAAMTRWREGSR